MPTMPMSYWTVDSPTSAFAHPNAWLIWQNSEVNLGSPRTMTELVRA